MAFLQYPFPPRRPIVTLSYGGGRPYGSVGGGPRLSDVGMPLLVGGGKKAGFTCGAGGGAPGGGQEDAEEERV